MRQALKSFRTTSFLVPALAVGLAGHAPASEWRPLSNTITNPDTGPWTLHLRESTGHSGIDVGITAQPDTCSGGWCVEDLAVSAATCETGRTYRLWVRSHDPGAEGLAVLGLKDAAGSPEFRCLISIQGDHAEFQNAVAGSGAKVALTQGALVLGQEEKPSGSAAEPEAAEKRSPLSPAADAPWFSPPPFKLPTQACMGGAEPVAAPRIEIEAF